MFSLQMRMMLLVAALFGIIYAVVVMVGSAMGVTSFYSYLFIALFFMFVQYMIGPKVVEWSMRVRYIKREDNPRLFAMVEDLARRANIPMPRIAISQVEIPNAFAFGRSVSDGRVCVTQGIMNLLNEEELKAVLGHELTHIRNWDVLTITLLSVIPMILYHVAWNFMFYGNRGSQREERGSNTALIGLAAFLFYFITNLLVLYGSRIREYFADRGSVELGNRPEALASALYKLVYGSARMNQESLKEVEGFKAFFANDPSRARVEIRELSQLDLDRNGTIDSAEIARLRNQDLNLNFGDRLMELMSTHPNMLKRIKQLSEFTPA